LKNRGKSPTLEDIIFEDRNKDYGVFLILKDSARRLRISFLLALLLFFFCLAVLWVWISIPLAMSFDSVSDVKFVSVTYDPSLITILKEPEKIFPEKKKAILFTPPRIVDEEPVLQDEQMASNTVIPSDTVKDEPKKDSLSAKESKSEEITGLQSGSSADTLMLVEFAPLFPGGPLALKQFISSNLIYPADALRRNVTGTVILNFLIDKDGSIGRIIISKKVDPVIDFEAIRIIETMPRWKPAVVKGKPIACMMVIPITFSIR
jgi:protein TonB